MPRSEAFDTRSIASVAKTVVSVIPPDLRAKTVRKKPLTIAQIKEVERGNRAVFSTASSRAPSETGSVTSKKTIKPSRFTIIPPRDKFCATIADVKANDKRIADLRETHARFVEEQRRRGVYVNPDVFQYFAEVERAEQERRRNEMEKRRAEEHALAMMQLAGRRPPPPSRRARSASPKPKGKSKPELLRVADVVEEDRLSQRKYDYSRDRDSDRDTGYRARIATPQPYPVRGAYFEPNPPFPPAPTYGRPTTPVAYPPPAYPPPRDYYPQTARRYDPRNEYGYGWHEPAW
eukprot:TRINITY_DN1124_c0_g1_i1.p1 TRINITY_DN1124_c0_g1~~TRINITY_DN1124_c0_g1_i1.p1  ORF type:complete len:291 (+),score=28.06 TRINITY_DN1124_c0_g1_i1:48-920(+)